MVAIDYHIVAPNVPNDWHSLNDLGWLPSAIATEIKEAVKLLPKIGEAVAAPQPISIPTDGVVYDPELAHCNSCEPERAAAIAIQLEKDKAAALKAWCEAQLLELEVERRRKLLEQGTLTSFETAADVPPQPAPAG